MHNVSGDDRSCGQDKNNIEKGQRGLQVVGSVLWDD